MNICTLDEIFDNYVDEYDRAIAGIRQCVFAYERECIDLIDKISNSTSVAEADNYFNFLYNIQGKLAKLLFSREIDIGSRLSLIVEEFDRLDDEDVRAYWIGKFRSGQRWPSK